MRPSRPSLLSLPLAALAAVVLLCAAPSALATGPTVVTLPATDVTATTATLQARVTTSVSAATVSFQYGPTTSYGSTTAQQDAPALPAPTQSISIPVDGLQPGTTYHVRAVAVSGMDTVYGRDVTLTTGASDGGSGTSNAGTTDPGNASGATPAATPATDGTPASPAPGADASQNGDAATRPALGRTVAVGAATGVVTVQPPVGGTANLTGSATLPTGTIVDATRGVAVLTTALDHDGHTQTGRFWGGTFEVRQPKDGRGMVQLVLRGGSFAACGAAQLRTAHAAAASKPPRSLWGRDRHGKFQVRGRGSVATVRGTRWLTEDRCDGTLTRVTEGAVAVRDLRRHRTVVARPGRPYLARVAR